MRARRKFSDSFKRGAVQRLASASMAEVAEACGVSVSILHRWSRQLGSAHSPATASARRRFSREFKEAAVLRLEQGERVRDVVRSEGLDPTVLRRWWHEWRRYGRSAFSGYGKSRVPPVSSRLVIVRFTPEEYEGILAACDSSLARSLPDFVRSRIVSARPAPGFGEIAGRIETLTAALRRAAETAAQVRAGRLSNICETTVAAPSTTRHPTTLYQRNEILVNR